MPVVSREPLVICDVCGLTDGDITKYDRLNAGYSMIKVFSIYPKPDEKEYIFVDRYDRVACINCYKKMMEESVTFRNMVQKGGYSDGYSGK